MASNRSNEQRAPGVLVRRGLSSAGYAEWLASRRAADQPVERVLAWAGSQSDPAADLVLGTRGRLSVRSGLPVLSELPVQSGPAEKSSRTWTHLGWHQIERGSWNGDDRRLTWTLYHGARGSAGLADPGRVPELFRERIAASIAVEEIVQIGGGRSVVVSGRRDLSTPDGPLEWRTSLSRGLTWQQPGLLDLAEDVLARLRAEYDRR